MDSKFEKEYKIVCFIMKRIEAKDGMMSLNFLMGQILLIPKTLRKLLGDSLGDVLLFLAKQSAYFIVKDDCVYLTGLQPREASSVKNRLFVQGTVVDSRFIQLITGQIVEIPADILAENKVTYGDRVVCNVITSTSERWIVSKLKIIEKLGENKSKRVKGYVNIVRSVGVEYGFIKHGQHRNEDIYFDKNSAVEMKKFKIGDIVICDFVRTVYGKYKAVKVEIFDVSSESFTNSFEEENVIATVEEDTSGDVQCNNKLYSQRGRVIKLTREMGFIRLSNGENVYFNIKLFYLNNEYQVGNLMQHLKIGDLVCFDANIGHEGVCKWRASRVWTEVVNNTKDVFEITVQGNILEVTHNEGLISFGPDVFSDRIFFSLENFYHDELQVSNLKSVLTEKETVSAVAHCWDSECKLKDTLRSKWVATCVWTGNTPKAILALQTKENIDFQTTEDINEIRDISTCVNSECNKRREEDGIPEESKKLNKTKSERELLIESVLSEKFDSNSECSETGTENLILTNGDSVIESEGTVQNDSECIAEATTNDTVESDSERIGEATSDEIKVACSCEYLSDILDSLEGMTEPTIAATADDLTESQISENMTKDLAELDNECSLTSELDITYSKVEKAECRKRIRNGEGYILKMRSMDGVIKYLEDEVHFTVDHFYENQSQAQNLEWCTRIGDKVNFDARLQQFDGVTKWTAMLVWKGARPQVVTALDKELRVEEYLRRNHPLVKENEFKSAIPIVTIRSKENMELEDNYLTASENDISDMSAYSISKKMREKRRRIRKIRRMKNEHSNAISEVKDVDDGDLDDDKVSNLMLSLSDDDISNSITAEIHGVTSSGSKTADVVGAENAATMINKVDNSSDSQNCKFINASTQTIFTGEIFCSNIYHNV